MSNEESNEKKSQIKIGQELLNTPFAEMVSKTALAIAEGQTKLDENSINIAKTLAKTTIKLPNLTDTNQEIEISLLALGIKPTFYEFQEATIEVKIALTIANSTEIKAGVEGGVNLGVFSASVNASYANKYDFKGEGSSLLRMRLKPVPPPTFLEDYLKDLIDKKKTDRKKLRETPKTPKTPKI